MPVVANRFPDLVVAVEKTADKGRAQRESGVAVSRQSAVATFALTTFSPVLTASDDVFTSHEEHHIADSWETLSESRTDDGAVAIIGNSAPHLDAQRFGTRRNYPIVARGPWGLTFWLRDPTDALDEPGIMRRQSVEHPGFGPWGGEDFVEVASRAMRPDLIQIAVESAGKIAFEEFRAG